jgi:hypothetical protein
MILHPSSKEHVIQSILEIVDEMDEKARLLMRNWDMTEMLESPEYIKLKDQLIEHLS